MEHSGNNMGISLQNIGFTVLPKNDGNCHGNQSANS
jgi:hypothetical protein